MCSWYQCGAGCGIRQKREPDFRHQLVCCALSASCEFLAVAVCCYHAGGYYTSRMSQNTFMVHMVVINLVNVHEFIGNSLEFLPREARIIPESSSETLTDWMNDWLTARLTTG